MKKLTLGEVRRVSQGYLVKNDEIWIWICRLASFPLCVRHRPYFTGGFMGKASWMLVERINQLYVSSCSSCSSSTPNRWDGSSMHFSLVWIFWAPWCITGGMVCDVSLHVDNKVSSLSASVKPPSGGKSCCFKPWMVLMAHCGSPEGPRAWGLPRPEVPDWPCASVYSWF